jgi:hypothetical protein
VAVPATATKGDVPIQGTVSIPGAPGTDLVVTLASSDTTEATVRATVTIPGGQTLTTFDITIVDDEEEDGVQTVTITSSADGWASGTATIDVRDNDSPNECPDGSGENPVVQDVTFKAGMECECVGTSSMTIGPGVTVEKGNTLAVNFHKKYGQVVRGALLQIRQQTHLSAFFNFIRDNVNPDFRSLCDSPMPGRCSGRGP